MTGIDVANAIKGHCQVVFTTAYDNHALDAFAAGAIDYLLKPIAKDRLIDAIAFKERLSSKAAPADFSQLMSELDKRLRAPTVERIRWISASVGDTIKMFPIDKVLFFTSDEKYTRVVTTEDEAHVRKPLKRLLMDSIQKSFGKCIVAP